jgi:hypothetical protein
MKELVISDRFPDQFFSSDLRTISFSNKIKFESKSEATCAYMLMKYLNLKLISGVTFQRSIGNKKLCDFFLPEHSIVLEYHPINLQHEFKNKESYTQLMKTISSLNARDRSSILKCLVEESTAQYYQKRRFCMDVCEDQEIRCSKLVIVGGPKSLYKLISLINPTFKILSEEDFLAEYKKVLKSPTSSLNRLV